MQQIAALSETTPRTIRGYLEAEIVPRSPFRGAATRYDRRQLLCLLAVRRLRMQERMALSEIRKRLKALSPAELEGLATQGVGPGPLADALGLQPAPPAAPAPTPVQALLAPHPQWTRLELALGLELHVRGDASASVLELAQRIHAACAAQAGRT